MFSLLILFGSLYNIICCESFTDSLQSQGVGKTIIPVCGARTSLMVFSGYQIFLVNKIPSVGLFKSNFKQFLFCFISTEIVQINFHFKNPGMSKRSSTLETLCL